MNLEPSSATLSVPLVHRYGPCAASQYSDMPTPSFSETLRHSRARTNYIKSRASTGMASTPDDAAVTVPTRLGGFVDSLEYMVTLGFGTPSVPQVLLMDTGSDVSWVQCAPCNSTECYPQKDPLFDPSKSSTYAPIACGADACNKLGDHYRNGCTSGGTQCGYRVEYGDGSSTRGVYSNETITFAPGITVKDFHFGCGHDQRGPSDKFDGLLGLGGAPESLVVQTASVYGGAFSYCLPALNSEAGFLALGVRPSAATNTSAFVFTPMWHLPMDATSYMVNMTGISVGGKPLDIPRSAFRGGMLIDSGTIVTELPETAYNALNAALRKAFAAYPMVASEDFDTCYNFTGYSNVTVPRVALTFSGGATIDLDVPNGILVKDCLAFRESGPDVGLGIIGNVNQRTLEVLYDAGHGKVGFRAGAC